MIQFYKIANLTVAMETGGKTAEQALPYLSDPVETPDIVIRPDWQEILERFPFASEESCEYLATGFSFYNQLLQFDGTMLHASAVVVDGRAYVFSANSGTGKSTHAALWLKTFGDRAYIINDDKPALRLEDGTWFVYGTPWSGKHDISVNTRVPLAGIAMVHRGEENTIEPWNGPEAIAAIMRQVRRPPDAVSRMKLLELLDKLMTMVPVWKLCCNMQPEAAITAYEAMSGEKASNASACGEET